MDYGEFIAALDVMDTPVTRKDTMQITKKITQVEGQIATLEGEVRHKFTLETLDSMHNKTLHESNHLNTYKTIDLMGQVRGLKEQVQSLVNVLTQQR